MINTLITIFASTPECPPKTFFGLDPWYKYINDSDHFKGCEIQNFNILPPHSDLPLVGLAIVDDLLRIAALVALGFVIAGSIQYITSEGNPDSTSRAKSTITNALAGLAIAIVAASFVSFLGNKLGG
jgi:hypothetical protein